MNKKWLVSLSLALLLLVVAACSGEDEAKKNNEGNEAQGEVPAENNEAAPEMPEPDLEGIPDVVAEVNGKPISKEEFVSTYEGQFQQMAIQSQMSGEEVDQDKLKKQIVEGMIGQELLIQEADNAGFDASKEAVDKTLNDLVKQNGLESKEEFMAALAEQGMDEKEVISILETQLKVDQLIASETGDVEPTEEELKEAYDQMVALQEQMGGQDGEEAQIPSLEEIKPELEEQVKNQKRTEATQMLVEKLRKDADVTINL